MPNAAMRVLRLFVITALIVVSVPAFATAQRTFVSSSGNDANLCSIAAPCRGFAAAIAKTNIGGEVIVLDSAGYGPVTITQSVSIIAPSGVYAGVSVFSGDGVTINNASAVVVLRGLTVNGQGGQNGINVIAASEVHVENVVVTGMQAGGIVMNATGSLLINDSTIRDNLGSGVVVASGTATLTNVRSERNFFHGFAIEGGTASIGSSTFSQNGSFGIRADGGPLAVHSTTITGNQSDGVFNDSAYVTLDDCAIDVNGSNGVEAHGTIIAPSNTLINGGHVNSNNRSGGNGGTYSNSDYAYFYLNGVTMYGNLFDVDATHNATYTYQNNAIYSLKTSFFFTFPFR